jgi:DNA gyrase subunit B
MRYDVDHIRKRPGMYIGGTGPAGVLNLAMEVLSNALDLVLAGTATTITARLGRDGTMAIVDDGPGMVVVDRDGPTFTELFTTRHETPTADGHFPHMHLAIGVGLGPVCALSEALDVTVRRPEGTYRQSFSRGRVTGDLVRADPDGGPTGTTVSILPDPEIFVEVDAAKVARSLVDELRTLAFLHPGLTTRVEIEGEEPLGFGPVADLVPLFEHAFADERSPFETEPLRLSMTADDVVLEALMTWSTHRFSTDVVAFANYRPLVEPERIAHGLEEGLRAVLGQGPVDVAIAGLHAVVHIQLRDPTFTGPTKGRLSNFEAIWHLADAMAQQLPGQLARHPELAADLAARVPTRENVAAGTVRDRWTY